MVPADFRSLVCEKCGDYAATYGKFCGDCIVERGETPLDYDAGLKVRALQRQREEKEGKITTEMVDLAHLEMEQHKEELGEVGPKFTKKEVVDKEVK